MTSVFNTFRFIRGGRDGARPTSWPREASVGRGCLPVLRRVSPSRWSQRRILIRAGEERSPGSSRGFALPNGVPTKHCDAVSDILLQRLAILRQPLPPAPRLRRTGCVARRMRHAVIQLTLLVGLLSGGAPAHAFDPGNQMQFADALYARGLYDLALDEYLLISREASDFPEMDVVLYRIGESHRRLRNPQAAARFYLRVQREHPTSAYAERAAFRRAEVLLTLGRPGDALPLFEALLEDEALAPALVAPSLYYYGDAARQIGRTDTASDAFASVIEQHADSPFAAYAALDLAQLLEADPARHDEVLPLLQTVNAAPPTEAVAIEGLFREADWHFRQGDFESAATLYDQLLRDHPDSRRAREARLQAAWSRHNIGAFAESAALASAVLEDEPEIEQAAEWWYVLANAQRQLLRADDARASYQRVKELAPDSDWARLAAYEMAVVAFRQDDFDQAIEAARQIEPDPALRQDLYWLLAESYASVGRHDEAVQYYRRLVDAAPDGEYAPRAMFRLGRVLQQRQDNAQAARTFRSLAEKFPDHDLAPQALMSAALSMALQDQLAEAVKDWQGLLADYPDAEMAGEARYQIALTKLQLGQSDAAREAFAEYVDQHPAGPWVADSFYRLGILWQEAADATQAEQAFRAALDAEPESQLAERIQYRLAVTLHEQEKDDEAAALLQELLDSAARDTLPLPLVEWLARYRLAASAYAEAEAAADFLVSRADSATWRQIAYALLGKAQQGQDNLAAAILAFEASKNEDARTSEGVEARWLLGEIQLQQGDLEQATANLEEAARLATSDDLLDVRARSYFALGRVAEKQEDARQAARYFLALALLFDDPDFVPEAMHRAAQALEVQGRVEEQQRTLDELAERYPDWTAP